jgi:hypothetical protein
MVVSGTGKKKYPLENSIISYGSLMGHLLDCARLISIQTKTGAVFTAPVSDFIFYQS